MDERPSSNGVSGEWGIVLTSFEGQCRDKVIPPLFGHSLGDSRKGLAEVLLARFTASIVPPSSNRRFSISNVVCRYQVRKSLDPKTRSLLERVSMVKRLDYLVIWREHEDA